jgi:uncharacterized protein YkvS
MGKKKLMINIIIAYDEKNASHGAYFEDCKSQLLSIIEEQNGSVNYNPNELPSNHCNNVFIDILMPKYKPNPFIFIAYSHGNEKALHCENTPYVKKDVNTHLFANSLFYTTACSTGKELGEDLINKGCLAFIGYKNDTIAFTEGLKKEVSKNCDNSGIIAFLADDITIFEAFKKMKNYYAQQIDRLNTVKDRLFAGHLVDAMESLVFLGRRDLRKENLFLS